MIVHVLGLALCCAYVVGDVSLTVDNGAKVRGNIKFTPNNDRYEASFAASPGARGLEPPRATPDYHQQQPLRDSYQHPIVGQHAARQHSTQYKRPTPPVASPTRYSLAPLRNSASTRRNQTTARLVQRKQSRRQRLRSRYQDCVPEEEEEEEDEEQVPVLTEHPVQKRPAIQQHFYDVEHKVIVRPVGTAVIELDQPEVVATNAEPAPAEPDQVQTEQVVPVDTTTGQDEVVVSPDSTPVVYHQPGVPGVQFGHHHQYGPQVPVYGFQQPTFSQYPPIYTHQYPQHGFYPQEHPQIFPQEHPQIFPHEHPQIFPHEHPQIFPQEHPQIFPQEHPQIFPHDHPHVHPQYIPPPTGPHDTPTVIITDPAGLKPPSHEEHIPQQHVITTPLPCPPKDSELIEPHAPSEHPESTTASTTVSDENEHQNQASEVHALETPIQPQNHSNLIDIVYANSPANPNATTKSEKQKQPSAATVHYTPDQADGDQIYQHEALERGDHSPKTAYHADQPDQFYHEGEQNVHSTSALQQPRVHVTHRSQPNGQAIHKPRTNEERLLDLYSVKGGVSEVEPSALAGHSQSLQLQPANIHQRARVISVTPAPDHEAQFESRERSQIRRVVVSKPIERLVPPQPAAYGSRISVKNPTDRYQETRRPVYVRPAPADLRNSQHSQTK